MQDQSRATSKSGRATPARSRSQERLSIVRWTADLGAVTADALAYRLDISLAAARGRLQGALRAGWLQSCRPLHGGPTLYTATRSGMRAVKCPLQPCRVSAGAASHLMLCAAVAAGLERCYPDHTVSGERTLRQQEAEHGGSLASAIVGRGAAGEPLLHRPDLVLWRRAMQPGSRPLAVEVELTVKAARRLEGICRAWARCDRVAGVIYVVAPEVERPLDRAIRKAGAQERVTAVPLGCVPGPAGNAIPNDA
jgi:hypothetical protein